MPDYHLKGWRWQFVDGWVFCKGDAEEGAPALVRQFKREHPGKSVTTAKRTVRAGGGTIPVTTVTVREKEPQCTCGEARGRRAGYLKEPCAYCIVGPEMLRASWEK